ncbi:hypothetical protein D915_010905 [Fasciola hepatica]|uniref:Uncharacterized protein n=1 Tax=Fasciola hepatica TaxID=6192 RepID=A0A4E0RME5_FASHE|nr:hypothetical protein D915_010905 [Fasciola hepatica]
MASRICLWKRQHLLCTMTIHTAASSSNQLEPRGLRIIPMVPAIKHKIPIEGLQLFGNLDKRDVYQYDPCHPPYSMAPMDGPKLPKWMTVFNRSYLHVGNKMVVCYLSNIGIDIRGSKMICVCAIEGSPLMGFRE